MELEVPVIWETRTRYDQPVPKQLEHLLWEGAKQTFMSGPWGYLLVQSLGREGYGMAMYQVDIKQTAFTFRAYSRVEENVLLVALAGGLRGTYFLTSGECKHARLAGQSYGQWAFPEGASTLFLLRSAQQVLGSHETVYLPAALLSELRQVAGRMKQHIVPALYMDGLAASLLQAYVAQVQQLEDNRYIEGVTFHFNAADLARIRKAKAVIDANPRSKPSLRKLAQEAGTNIDMLKKGFKHVYGQTVHQYSLAASLTLAKQMMLATTKPAKEVAYDCGFRNYPHFIQQFKRRWGVTPGALRKTT